MYDILYRIIAFNTLHSSNVLAYVVTLNMLVDKNRGACHVIFYCLDGIGDFLAYLIGTDKIKNA